MTRALFEIRREGERVTSKAIAGLVPYRHGHINRLGDYALNIARRTDPPDFNVKVIDDKVPVENLQ